MAFPPAFLDEIRARLPVSEIVGKRVRLIRAGREHKACCPFHNEKTPSFTVNDDKGFFHCFGCGAHGDVIGFAMRIDNLPFPEAVENLAAAAGLEVPRPSPAEREREEARRTLYDVVEAACAWYQAQIRAPAGRAALDYLRGRGLDEATIAEFRLGYAPDQRGGVKAALKAAGIGETELVEAGLLVSPEGGGERYDFFRGRVMFPIMDRRGRPVAFGGRVMGDGQPKYLNSRDTPLFDKGRTLYALDKAAPGVRRGAELIVAEGYMDVIALHAAGFAGAVAPLGTALTESQIEALWKLAPEPLICFDGDAAGQRAAARAADRALPLLKPGHSLRFVRLPPGDDPDSLIRRGGPAAVAEALARPRGLADMVWEAEAAGRSADTPERRAGLEAALRQHISRIADRSVQSQYFKLLILDRFRAAFAPPPPARRGRNRAFPGRGGTARWAPAATPGVSVPGVLRRRGEVLLATAVNHPWLVTAAAEEFAGVPLPSAELDRFRKEILNVVGARPDLDSAAVQSHLERAGLAAALAGILQPSLYRLWPFARPDAGRDAVRAGWSQLLALIHERELAGDVDRCRQELAADMSEPALARLDETVRQARWAGEQARQAGDEADGADPAPPERQRQQ